MGICLFKGLCKDGAIAVLQDRSLLWGQRLLWTLLHCLLLTPHLQLPTASVEGAELGQSLLGQLLALLTCCGKAGGQRIIVGQAPSRDQCCRLKGPRAWGAHQCPAALSVFWVLQLEMERVSIFLWEERRWAGWLARSLPLGQVHTRLPPAQVLEVSASPFMPVISFLLPRAGPDALS